MKTQNQITEMFETRLNAIEIFIGHLQSRLRQPEKYINAHKSIKRELGELLIEQTFLERAIRMIGDNRPQKIILETNYCKGE